MWFGLGDFQLVAREVGREGRKNSYLSYQALLVHGKGGCLPYIFPVWLNPETCYFTKAVAPAGVLS